MITDFRVSQKTKRPACCNFHCCGNHFGRIEVSKYARARSVNRIIKTRRYAKRVERAITRKLILNEMNDSE